MLMALGEEYDGMPDDHRPRADTADELVHSVGVSSSEELVDRLAERLLDRMTGISPSESRKKRGSWGHQIPNKKSLGLQLLSALGMSGALLVGGWFLWVRDGVNASASTEDVVKAATTAVKEHSENGTHPKIEKRLEGVELEQRTIRESQIRQEVTSEQQTKVLVEIQRDLKRIRR